MTPSAWLAEFHRQWMKARARRTESAVRAFRRDWEDLLDDAGITSAEDRKAAAREVEKLPQFKLHRHRSRSYLLQKIELPLEHEAWLHSMFGSQAGGDLQRLSLDVVSAWEAREHSLLTEEWRSFAQRLRTSAEAAQVLGPFNWREPERMESLMKLVFELTSREWTHGTLVRDASVVLGYDSKLLEAQESFIVRALEVLFGREMTLEALGIQTSNSVLHFSGPLTLHFVDGSSHETEALRFEATVSVAEIERAVRITTTAERILSVENRKTTFLQLARADATRSTLIIATSFPTQAVRRVLEKLPVELPHYHFGDTDPSGWDILRSLRSVTKRAVLPFMMTWRPREGVPLTKRDQQVLDRLLGDPQMRDCAEALRAMTWAGTRGDFEQESLGAPSLREWPFLVS